MSFFSELSWRNAIRMAGLYRVGAWLIEQVTETVLPRFDVPNGVLRATMIVILPEPSAAMFAPRTDKDEQDKHPAPRATVRGEELAWS